MSSKKKILSAITVIALIISLLPVSALALTEAPTAAPQFSDMPDDWSTPALESAVSNGLLNGIDGQIMPGAKLTRDNCRPGLWRDGQG